MRNKRKVSEYEDDLNLILVMYLLSYTVFIAGPRIGSAGLEDCALCQETMTSSELAAKARDGQFEGQ